VVKTGGGWSKQAVDGSKWAVDDPKWMAGGPKRAVVGYPPARGGAWRWHHRCCGVTWRWRRRHRGGGGGDVAMASSPWW